MFQTDHNVHSKLIQSSPLTVTVLGRQKSVTVSGSFLLCHCIQTFLLYKGPIGGSEKCSCKRGSFFLCHCNQCSVTVSVEACISLDCVLQGSILLQFLFIVFFTFSGKRCCRLLRRRSSNLILLESGLLYLDDKESLSETESGP